MRNHAGKAAKLRAVLQALPPPGEVKRRGIFIILGGGQYVAMGEGYEGIAGRISPWERAKMERSDRIHAEIIKTGFTLQHRQRDFQDDGSEQPADPRQITLDPRQIERDIASFEPPQQPQRAEPVNEEQLRIARYLMRFGKEVYAMTYNELMADVNFLKRRIENGTKLEEGEIDRLATYIMRLEQLKGTIQ